MLSLPANLLPWRNQIAQLTDLLQFPWKFTVPRLKTSFTEIFNPLELREAGWMGTKSGGQRVSPTLACKLLNPWSQAIPASNSTHSTQYPFWNTVPPSSCFYGTFSKPVQQAYCIQVMRCMREPTAFHGHLPTVIYLLPYKSLLCCMAVLSGTLCL